MYLPKEVEWILQRLNRAGFSAFVVGGCVRDSLRGVTPHDWDLCTQALPEEIEQVFAGHPLKRTGARQGTITLILQHHPYEITTYRAEGSYSDHRRPDRVHYIDQVEPDLARRDFTINAMAYHPDVGLVDPFGGRQDLEQSVLRCVGEAEQRLQEDPLRILRAARFCATFGFTVAPETEAAMRQKRQQLCHVAPERQWSEIKQLFLQPYLGRVLRHFPDILFVVWPELAPMHGMDQCHPFHRWDVYEHSITSTENADNDLILRLTAFFHDSGKPKCFTLDKQGIGHMKGHPQVSEQLAEIALRRLRVEKAKQLLEECSVKETALQSGFWDTQSLVRVFKKYEGVTPGEYKKGLQNR